MVYHTLLAAATRWAFWAVILWIAVLIATNRRSLAEGLRYLGQLQRWRPDDRVRVRQDGPFWICYPLVDGVNTERLRLIRERIATHGARAEELPVPGETLPNLLVRLGPPGPLTLFVAHYDKSRETSSYQGACDNTAAIAVLLAALPELLATPPTRPIGLLFSAAEERGWLGARAFLDHAHAAGPVIEAVVNLDMLGRDRLAIRPSTLPGFLFRLPLLGQFVYDGRRIRRGRAYRQPDPRLIERLAALAGDDLVVYHCFTASSDSNVFEAAGIPTVSISSADMAYLDRVWERDSDRIELLDERNLEMARRLVVGVATGRGDGEMGRQGDRENGRTDSR